MKSEIVRLLLSSGNALAQAPAEFAVKTYYAKRVAYYGKSMTALRRLQISYVSIKLTPSEPMILRRALFGQIVRAAPAKRARISVGLEQARRGGGKAASRILD